MIRHVPYLAEEAIERDAAALLAEFEHARGMVLEPPCPSSEFFGELRRFRNGGSGSVSV